MTKEDFYKINHVLYELMQLDNETPVKINGIDKNVDFFFPFNDGSYGYDDDPRGDCEEEGIEFLEKMTIPIKLEYPKYRVQKIEYADTSTEWFYDKEEALNYAENAWNHLTKNEQKKQRIEVQTNISILGYDDIKRYDNTCKIEDETVIVNNEEELQNMLELNAIAYIDSDGVEFSKKELFEIAHSSSYPIESLFDTWTVVYE